MLNRALAEGAITKDEKRFIWVQGPNRPYFYHIPKIHKEFNAPTWPSYRFGGQLHNQQSVTLYYVVRMLVAELT